MKNSLEWFGGFMVVFGIPLIISIFIGDKAVEGYAIGLMVSLSIAWYNLDFRKHR